MIQHLIEIIEFRSWIQGFVDSHDDSWTPNQQQWNSIHEKIQGCASDSKKETNELIANFLQLKLWLSGINDLMCDDDWVPSFKQWKKITTKLFELNTDNVEKMIIGPQVINQPSYMIPDHNQPAIIQPQIMERSTLSEPTKNETYQTAFF